MQFEIGMDFSSVINLIGEDKIKDKKELGNGYKWITGWINLFEEYICMSFCFSPDCKLKMINIYPQIHEGDKEKSWDDATEAQMKQEYKLCKKWFSKHKRKLPKSAELFKDPRNWSAGITIR